MSSTTNSNQASASGSNIGYCHNCDRQVEIDRESFTCKQCNGGFIELFDVESRPSQQDRVRTETFNLNDGVCIPFLKLFELFRNLLSV